MRPHLASLVEDFRARPQEIAVVRHRGVRRYATTYGELAHLAGRFAAELQRRGVQPGERVVLWGANSAEWMACFFGCLLRGVLAVPLDAAGSAAFAGRVLAETSPRLVVADGALSAKLHGVRDGLSFSGLAALPDAPCFDVDASVREDTPFQIVFTSGTTSEPKGIVHTHRNVLASLTPIETEIRKYLRYERLVHPLRFLHTLPLSHVFGQFMGLWVPALLRAEVHFIATPEPARDVALIHRERISVLIAVPRVLELLRAHVVARFPDLPQEMASGAALPVLRRWWHFRRIHRVFGWKFWALICGGAALSAELESFWNTLGFALIQGYGMTETSALITLNHPFHIGRGSVGKVLPGRELRLTEAGEIEVRGPMVSTATWKNGALRQNASEWLSTGDLAEQSESGELRFLGRQGDAIVMAAGLNVFPADLEAALLAQAGVRAAVVVACASAAGEEPVAVVLFAGDDAALAGAVSAANATLAEFQQIRRTLRWPRAAFPYTSTGKLLRREVRAWACAELQAQGEGTTPADPLVQLIASITGATPASADDSARLSEDLHLDSLGRVQLASQLELSLGVFLSDDDVAAAKTLGELRQRTGLAATATISAERVEANSPSAREKSVAPAAVLPSEPVRPRSVRAPAAQHRYPHWPWLAPVRWLRNLYQELVARPLIALLLAPRVVRPAEALGGGPFLMVANHVTALDGALVLYGLPGRLRRRIAIAMAGEMLLDYRRARNQGNAALNLLAPFAYWLLTALYNVFPLPRLEGFRQSFAHAGEALDRGQSVLVFPEGTRSRAGHMLALRQGIGLLASQAYVAVLPVALVGLEELRTRRVRWFRSGRLEIRVGRPVCLGEDATPAEWNKAVEEALEALVE